MPKEPDPDHEEVTSLTTLIPQIEVDYVTHFCPHD